MFRTGTTGDSSCSVPGTLGNGIYSEAVGDGFFSVPDATGNGICSNTVDNSSCNVYSAAGDGICSNATGDGSQPSHTGDGICSNATGNSLKLLDMGGGIYSNATTNSSCNDAVGDRSCSVSSTTGDGMCADAIGDGSDLSQAFKGSYSDAAGRILLRPWHHGQWPLLQRHRQRLLICWVTGIYSNVGAMGDSLTPYGAVGNSICSEAMGDAYFSVPCATGTSSDPMPRRTAPDPP